MNNFMNEKNCLSEEQRKETAKELLENMGNILREMENQIAMISDAVYRGGNCVVENEPNNDLPAMPPMTIMMRDQRDMAEYLLKEIVKIREALW